MRSALILLIMCSCSVPFVEGESTPLSDLIIGEHVFARRELANGLRAVAVQEEGDTTTVFMAVAVGTRNETAETTGLAHLTEHAMFAGTPTTGTDLHEKTIVDWGGESNAFTRDDYTMYYDHHFPPSKLKTVLAMEADRLRNLSLDPAPTLHERHRLELEEKHSYQPSDGREQSLESVIFQHHPYRHGLRDEDGHTSARHLPVSAIRNFYDTYYHPNRVAVVVVGPSDPQSVLNEIEACFASLAPGPEFTIPQEPIPSQPRRTFLTSTLPRDRHVECWLIPEMGHPHRPALEVLATLMGRVELNCGVPMSVGMGGRIDRDWFRIDWSAADSDATDQARDEINTVLNSFREGKARLSDLEEVKELMIRALESKRLSARPYFALAETVAWRESHHLSETLSTYGDDIRAVTALDIQQVAQQWLLSSRSVTVVFAGTGAAVAPLPESPRELRAAAAEASETGDFARAVEAYGMLLERMPDKMNTVIHYAERGKLFMEMKDFDAAIADFEAALVVIDYPAVRDYLEEAHARKARALRGDFQEE